MRTLSHGLHVGSSSLTWDRTRAPCIGSVESYPLRHQGSPCLHKILNKNLWQLELGFTMWKREANHPLKSGFQEGRSFSPITNLGGWQPRCGMGDPRASGTCLCIPAATSTFKMTLWALAISSHFCLPVSKKEEVWRTSLLLGPLPESPSHWQNLVSWLHLAAVEAGKYGLYPRQPCARLKLDVLLLRKKKG